MRRAILLIIYKKSEDKNHYKNNNLFFNKTLSFFDKKDALTKYKKIKKKERSSQKFW